MEMLYASKASQGLMQTMYEKKEYLDVFVLTGAFRVRERFTHVIVPIILVIILIVLILVLASFTVVLIILSASLKPSQDHLRKAYSTNQTLLYSVLQ